MRDSHLSCPRDGKRLAIDELEEEGQALVTHCCLECSYTERAPGERPQQTERDGPSFMEQIRDKVRAGK